MLFTRNNGRHGNKQSNSTIPSKNKNIKKMTQNVKPSPPPQERKVYWGAPTWIFFHTIAHKIKDEKFLQLKSALLKFIYQICSYLPCPICTEHAKAYLKNVNFNNITTKTALKHMLFEFHNNVNKRKNYENFDINKLNSTYENVNLVNSINRFINVYKVSFLSPTNISFTTHRKEVINEFTTWFKENIHCFES